MFSIVIVNWNSGRQLSDCLDSIHRFGSNHVDSVVVIDNGSTDDSLCFNDPGVPITLVRAKKNLGFARACNLGAKECKSEYILFLNPDARLMEGTLEKVLCFMASEAAASVGICGVRLLDEVGSVHRHCARFPSFWTYLWHGLGLSVLAPSVFRPHFMSEFDHLSNRDVDQVIGAFFVVRHAIFKVLGGFDERFFVYFEELDFALRAKKCGWSSHYFAEAVAFHKGGGSSEQVKAHRLFYSLRSRILYACKNFSAAGAWGTMSSTLLIEPLTRLGFAVGRRRWDDAGNTLRAYAMLIKALPEVFCAGPFYSEKKLK